MAIVTSEYFAQALVKAGVIPDIAQVRRIVIDAQGGHALMVYAEYFGDEHWLDVAPLLTGVEVMVRHGGDLTPHQQHIAGAELVNTETGEVIATADPQTVIYP